MSSIDESVAALDAALRRLESVVDGLLARAGDPALARKEVAALIEDRARLADELEAALAREGELQALADEASAALGSAIEEVRAALDREA